MIVMIILTLLLSNFGQSFSNYINSSQELSESTMVSQSCKSWIYFRLLIGYILFWIGVCIGIFKGVQFPGSGMLTTVSALLSAQIQATTNQVGSNTKRCRASSCKLKTTRSRLPESKYHL